MAAPAPIVSNKRQQSIPVAEGSNRVSGFLDATTTPGSQRTGDLAVSQTHQVVQVVKAGQTTLLNFAGISYYFEFIGSTAGVANTSLLGVRPISRGSARPQILHVQGTGLRFGTTPFIQLEINNGSGADVLFTVDIGGGVPNNSYDEYLDKRVIISGASTGGTTVNVTTPPGTSIVIQGDSTTNLAFKTRSAGWGDSLAAGVSQQVTGGGIAGKVRKSILFSNDDAAAVLQVLDAAGNIFATIQPASAWYNESSDTFSLKNPTANPVTCHIGEVYYN